MKTWNDFLAEDPGSELDLRIIAAVEIELRALQSHRRRNFFVWLAPATLGAVAVLLWRNEFSTSKTDRPSDALLMADIENEMSAANEENFDILADMELLEDLEVLEQWNPTKS